MFPKIVIIQKSDGTATNACIIFRDDGKYGLIISGKTDGAPINKSNAKIETEVDSLI